MASTGKYAMPHVRRMSRRVSTMRRGCILNTNSFPPRGLWRCTHTVMVSHVKAANTATAKMITIANTAIGISPRLSGSAAMLTPKGYVSLLSHAVELSHSKPALRCREKGSEMVCSASMMNVRPTMRAFEL